MTLCSRCSAFDIQTFTPATFPTRGYPLLGVVKAAEKDNCSFCSLLLDQFRLIYGRDELPYLFDESGSPDKAGLSLLGQLVKRVSVTIRHAKDLAIPPWIHFSVKRGENQEDTTESGLNIVEITASVLNLPNKKEWYGIWGKYLGYTVGFQAQFNGFCNGPWEDRWKKAIHLRVAADLGTPAHESGDISGSLSLDQHTWSESHYEQIKQWHETCRDEHNCNVTMSGIDFVNAEKASLPTRCVEFKFLDRQNIWTSSMGWCLREPDDSERGKYIALSHRWTQDTEEAKTTKDNYAHRLNKWSQERGNELQARGSLSALFLDVGRLACHLGIRYVWIDSICIIQDDKDDWDREALKMGTYYQHSWLTIGAVATSVSGGLFRTLDPTMIPRVTRLPYRDQSGQQNGHFYVQATSSQRYTNEYERYVINSELLSRGWVYQEWTLSRRILVVSEVRLFLQCQKPSPYSLDGHLISSDDFRNANFRYLPGNVLIAKDSVEEILESWEQVVTTFSGLQISNFEEDRLVALSGIAAEYGLAFNAHVNLTESVKQYQFISGLWTEWPRGLQWEQAAPITQTRVRGFPTWSWLSIASETEAEAAQETPKKLSGLRIAWAPRESPTMKEINLSTFGTPISVPLDEEQSPLFEQAGTCQYVNQYGNDNRFAIWPLRGGIIQLLVGANFDSEEDAAAAGATTAHDSEWDRSMWRKVSLGSSPDVVVGWASLEHPAHQLDETLPLPITLSAILVSKLCKVQNGPDSIEGHLSGFHIEGHLSGFHDAFKVLFLERSSIVCFDNCYERVGVGRLFGNTIGAVLQAATEVDINLV